MDRSARDQTAIRFYRHILEGGDTKVEENAKREFQHDVASHRYSTDSSVSVSIRNDFSQKSSLMTEEELNLFSWNVKHAEYSLQSSSFFI